ncbi:MBL fold metallo-hydrolase, partial [Shinella sp.]|uniref:MBL fold metallo-hydrolase n=1 Tax=Shinella sp. TaxID=1870904 RepID=UPI0028A90557
MGFRAGGRYRPSRARARLRRGADDGLRLSHRGGDGRAARAQQDRRGLSARGRRGAQCRQWRRQADELHRNRVQVTAVSSTTQDDAPRFDLDFKPAYGEAVPVAPGVQRLTVNNPSPFTFHGTNSYIVGGTSVAVIDPGPEDEAHFAALMRALAGREVTHIAVSHTHRDHSPLARRLKAETGAIIVAEGPHRAARPLHEGE